MDYHSTVNLSDNLYTTAFPIAIGSAIGKNRGLLICGDTSILGNGFGGTAEVVIYTDRGVTAVQNVQIYRAAGTPSGNLVKLLECRVWGVKSIGAGLTCAAIA